jgi:predicted amidohydrolase
MNVVHDKEENLAKYMQYIDEAAAQGVRLIVFPEQSLQGYLYGLDHSFTAEELDYHYRNAEPIPGESTNKLVEKAREKSMYIVFGLTEERQGAFSPLLLNSAVAVGPEGLVGVYRKVHLPGDERHIYRRGDSWPVLETELGRLGMLICWDAAFPESARELTLRGAEILVMPTAWPKGASGHYDLFTRARAAENCRWFIAANQVGKCDKGQMEYYGHSRIVDPRGMIVADSGEEEGLTVVTIEVKEGITRCQNSIFYALQWRVPTMYKRIADETIYYPDASYT